MAQRQRLTKPLVVDPASGHSHTVVFLHRFPESTTDEELRGKVLSEKLTRNHQTLRQQFPAVRWVFPSCKAQARPWNNLSAEDRAAVGMAAGGLPYVTQVVLQEAERAGGLDRVVVGGQGEAAEAAHEAVSSFPEAGAGAYDSDEELAAFLWDRFTLAEAGLADLRLAGFVGMHAQGGQLTRDVKTFGLLSKGVPTTRKINPTIIKNTPHKFIHGGYRVQTSTWDGRRIDDFAEFLESIGVHRLVVVGGEGHGGGGGGSTSSSSNETLTPRERPDPRGKRTDGRDELSDMQKHAAQVAREKKAREAQRQTALRRIEADKVERKIRQERERQKRLNGGNPARPAGSTNLLGGGPPPAGQPQAGVPPPYQPHQPGQAVPGSFPRQTPDLSDDGPRDGDQGAAEDGAMMEGGPYEPPSKRKARREQGRPVGGGTAWGPQSQVRGEMSLAQMEALGLVGAEEKIDD